LFTAALAAPFVDAGKMPYAIMEQFTPEALVQTFLRTFYAGLRPRADR